MGVFARAFLLLLAVPAQAESLTQGQIIAGSGAARHFVEIPRGTYVVLTADVFNSSATISIKEAQGAEVATLTPLTDLAGTSFVEFITMAGGTYEIAVTPAGSGPASVVYEVRVEEARAAKSGDDARVIAAKRVGNALTVLQQDPPDAKRLAEALRLVVGVCANDNERNVHARTVAGALETAAPHFKEAEAQFRNALEQAAPGDSYRQAVLLNHLALVLSKLGRFPETLDAATRAVPAADKSGSPYLQATARSYVCAMLMQAGRMSQAIASCREAAAIAGEKQILAIGAETHVRLAQMLGLDGDPEADSYGRRAVEAFRTLKNSQGLAYALTTLSDLCYRRGDPQCALNYASADSGFASYRITVRSGGEVVATAGAKAQIIQRRRVVSLVIPVAFSGRQVFECAGQRNRGGSISGDSG